MTLMVMMLTAPLEGFLAAFPFELRMDVLKSLSTLMPV